VYDRVHDRFPDGDYWERPKVGPLHGSDDCLARHVFSQEGNYFFSGSWKVRQHVRGIKYPAPVATREPAHLDPSIGKMIKPGWAEQKDSANRWA